MALYVLPRGTLRRELLAALRQARWPRSRRTNRRGQIPNMSPTVKRPADVATRTVPGHWEGDLIKEAHNGSAVGTLVERTTRLVILARLEGTDARSACHGLTNKLEHMRAPLRTTLTDDRGNEMAKHERLTYRHSIRVFFADLDSPWQRSTNENTKWAAAPVSAQGHQLVELHPARAEHHRPSTRHPPKMSSLGHAAEGFCAAAPSSTRCTWNLKPPCYTK